MHDTVMATETAVPRSQAEERGRAAVVLFAASLFGSAVLLFSLEPMVAKVLLPKLGGAPLVCSAWMVCFETLLLAGYSAACLIFGRRAPRRSAWLYASVLAAGAAVLPLAFVRLHTAADRPALWLLLELTRVAGLP